MAISCGIVGVSGSGKSTAHVVNPDGKVDFSAEGYKGMDTKSHYIINADKKRLPFKGGMWSPENKNYKQTSDSQEIITILRQISTKGTHIKSVSIDTCNGIMCDFEMLEKKKSFNSWMDLASSIYEILTVINDELRDDLIVYVQFHSSLSSDVDSNNIKSILTNGRKLEKIKLESKLPIVLYSKIDYGTSGDNIYSFETQANMSTGKSPINMFSEFLIPNSLKLVDDTIRKYYGI